MAALSSIIAIVLGSGRPNGDTYQACQEVVQYLEASFYNLQDYRIGPSQYEATQSDDFISLISKISSSSELIILATPVYWYAASAQLKCFVDRLTDLLVTEHSIAGQLLGKSLALISRSNDDDCPPEFSLPFQRTADYLGMKWIGHIHFFDGGPTAIDLSRFVAKCTQAT